MSEPAASGGKRRKGAVGALVLLMGLNLLNYMDRTVLASVESAIEPEFFKPGDASSGFWMGLLATAFLVTYMVFAPMFGVVADRWRRWWIVGLGVLTAGVASAGSGWAGTFGVLLLMRALVGLSEAAYGPAAPTLLSDLFPVERRGGALAWFYMAIPVGSALGYVYGGAMLSATGSWRPGFHWLLAPALLLGTVCFFMGEPARGSADAGGAPVRKARWADYVLMLKAPSLLYNCAGMTLMTFAVGGMSFWMPRFFKERLLPTSTKSPTELLNEVNRSFGQITVVAGITATLAGGYLADRLLKKYPGAYLGMSGLAIVLGFPLFVGVLYAPFPYAWWCLAGAIFFIFLNTGPANAALANVTHPAVRSSAFALNIFIVHALGDAISPPLIGGIAGKAPGWFGTATPAGGLAAAFLVVGVAMILAGVAWMMGARHLARDTELAPTRLAA
ncbi:MAG: MFS transporter [Phycisphaerales bacterium]|nr:MFS transporter [Phycisphaerales bacterium]